jgi:DNA helicase TIP49 (TBP-interacting protein)
MRVEVLVIYSGNMKKLAEAIEADISRNAIVTVQEIREVIDREVIDDELSSLYNSDAII